MVVVGYGCMVELLISVRKVGGAKMGVGQWERVSLQAKAELGQTCRMKGVERGKQGFEGEFLILAVTDKLKEIFQF